VSPALQAFLASLAGGGIAFTVVGYFVVRLIRGYDDGLKAVNKRLDDLGSQMGNNHLAVLNQMDGLEKDGLLAQQKWSEELRMLERALPQTYVRREEQAAALAALGSRLDLMQTGQNRIIDRLDKIHDSLSSTARP